MIKIGLPDGSLREYDQPLSVYELAASISPALAKAAVAGRVEGVLVDCEFMIGANARVSIVTPHRARRPGDPPTLLLDDTRDGDQATASPRSAADGIGAG